MVSHPYTAFNVKDLKQASLWKNLLGIKPKENAIIAINNLFASQGVASINQEGIQQIALQYNVDLRKSFLPELFDFYKSFLVFCLTDKFLSDEEVKELRTLKEVLSLNDEEVNQIHQEVTGELYKMEVERVIQDRRLSEKEKRFLKEIQKNLKINDSLANEIFQETANELLTKVMDEALADNLLTEEEEQELEEIKKSLNINIVLEGSARANFEKCRLFWQIENGKLPLLETDLFLEDEPCHFFTKAEWLEQKISTKYEDNTTLQSKLAQGYHFKTENKEMKPELEDIWATMDNGKVYITDKKIILSGNDGDKYVYLNNIMDFSAFSNGINIVEKGKSIFIQFKHHIDVFAMILGKAIHNL